MNGPAVEPLLLLLVAGHLLGDFAFQTLWMVEGKSRFRILLAHAGVVMLVQLTVLTPFLGRAVLVAVAAIGVLHALIDLVKARWPWSWPGRLPLFLLDQAGHGAVLLGVFVALRDRADLLSTFVPEAWVQPWAVAASVAGAFAFNATGGSALVSSVLAILSPDLEEEESEATGMRGSGRLIGILERTITLVLILLGEWAAIVLLVAAKSIARFEELKERRFAEYYLVGTLTSLLVAILVGLALGAVLGGP